MREPEDPRKCVTLWAVSFALYFTHYNVARVHQTLRVTPAMEAGLCDHVWGVNKIVGLLES